MKASSTTFTYTAQRSSYISIISAFFFLAVVEGGVMSLLIVLFVSNALIKLILFSVIGILFLFIISKILSPLWTHHSLNASYLQLHYGIDFKASVPRSAITAAQKVNEKLGIIPGTKYEAEKQRIIVAFSEQGQVLLSLDKSYPFRVGLLGGGNADQILINADHPDEFLAALGPSTLPGASDPTGELTSRPVEAGVVELGGGEACLADLSLIHSITQSPNSTALAIHTENLSRRYHNFVAVDRLNLAIRQGEIYGFLGANGAGKTTTMKMLVGLLKPTGGHAEISGYDIESESLKAKATLGYVADRSMLYERLTGREFLAFLAQMRGIPRKEADRRIEHLLDLLELTNRANSPCGAYSFGMKRKLALAGALLHQPSVLILDEPLNGLDPLSAHRLKALFAELAANGTTIFLSTHDLATAESICHRVGIISQGRLLVEGSADELREIAAAPDLESVFLALTAESTGVAL